MTSNDIDMLTETDKPGYHWTTYRYGEYKDGKFTKHPPKVGPEEYFANFLWHKYTKMRVHGVPPLLTIYTFWAI